MHVTFIIVTIQPVKLDQRHTTTGRWVGTDTYRYRSFFLFTNAHTFLLEPSFPNNISPSEPAQSGALTWSTTHYSSRPVWGFVVRNSRKLRLTTQTGSLKLYPMLSGV
jgi:hypothetical protein